MPDQQARSEATHVIAKLVQFSENGGFKRVLVIEKPTIKDVLHYVYDHSLGKDYQTGIVWIRDAQRALHYGLLYKGHLVNDLLKLEDGSVVDLQAFTSVQPVNKQLIRHISTAFDKANKNLETKPKLIP